MVLAGAIGKAIEVRRGGVAPQRLPQAPARHVPDDGEEPRTVGSVLLEPRQGAERAHERVLEHIRHRVAAHARGERDGEEKIPGFLPWASRAACRRAVAGIIGVSAPRAQC